MQKRRGCPPRLLAHRPAPGSSRSAHYPLVRHPLSTGLSSCSGQQRCLHSAVASSRRLSALLFDVRWPPAHHGHHGRGPLRKSCARVAFDAGTAPTCGGAAWHSAARRRSWSIAGKPFFSAGVTLARFPARHSAIDALHRSPRRWHRRGRCHPSQGLISTRSYTATGSPVPAGAGSCRGSGVGQVHGVPGG
jgi:hypothetical protein